MTCDCDKCENKCEEFLHHPAGLFEDEINLIQEMLAKKLARKNDPTLEGFTPNIKNLYYEFDDNITIVMIDTDIGPIFGWSKFNPTDTKTLYKEQADGSYKIEEKSMFSQHTGLVKAMSRALDKYITR